MKVYSPETIPEGTRRGLYHTEFIGGVLTGSGFLCYNDHYLYKIRDEEEHFIF